MNMTGMNYDAGSLLSNEIHIYKFSNADSAMDVRQMGLWMDLIPIFENFKIHPGFPLLNLVSKVQPFIGKYLLKIYKVVLENTTFSKEFCY